MDRKMDTTGEIKPLSRKVQRDAKPRHTKRFSLALLSLLLIAALAGLYHLPSTAAEVGDTIYISTQAELMQIAEAVNVGSNDYQNKTIILSNDIALSGDWTPIGNKANAFKGVFNGRGRTISGLHINRASDDYQGLFGHIYGPTAEVKNLTVSGDVTGNQDVGLIAGANVNGKITNCVANGTVSGTANVGGIVGQNTTTDGTATVANCTASGTVCGGTNVGGGVGSNSSNGNSTATVANCVTNGTTVSGDINVGGVIGSNFTSGGMATVINCEASGTVSGDGFVGGIVGGNGAHSSGTATVANCVARRTVSGTDFVGGTAGRNEANGDNSTATVANCAASGTVSGTNHVGGIVGFSEANSSGTATVANCAASGTVSNIGNFGGVVGWNYTLDGTAAVTNCGWLGTSAASGIGTNNNGTSADVVSYDASAKIVVACLPDPMLLKLATGGTGAVTLKTYPFEAERFDTYVQNVTASVSPDIASVTPSGNTITVTAKTTPGAAAIATSFHITPTWFHGNCDATSPDAYSAKLSPKVALVVKAGTQPKPQPQPSSSGGCNAGLGALAMLALIPVTLKKKR